MTGEGWGRLPDCTSGARITLGSRRSAAGQISESVTGLPYGRGRSYGDQAQTLGSQWHTAALDKFIRFCPHTGVLEAEAGITLGAIQQTLLPQGWMLPVTPGTQHASLGGAIANDVHGKNHHGWGSFGAHVRGITLLRSNGERRALAPTDPWFAATVGGMGLTGLITDARVQLRRVPGPWLRTQVQTFAGLDEFFALNAAAEATHEYSVAWVDCLHGERGVLLSGDHAEHCAPAPRSKPKCVPVTPPVSAVNRLSLRMFNAAYYRAHQWRQGAHYSHYQSFFYPLDHIAEWNRLYGPRGFYQYQSVVPWPDASAVTRAMLKAIRQSGQGSMLAVLKCFGARPNVGMLSFAMPGVTLALDFPNRGDHTHQLFARLDAMVTEAGGRLYAAKDARMPAAMFRQGYPAWDAFTAYRDPGIRSHMADRLWTP